MDVVVGVVGRLVREKGLSRGLRSRATSAPSPPRVAVRRDRAGGTAQVRLAESAMTVRPLAPPECGSSAAGTTSCACIGAWTCTCSPRTARAFPGRLWRQLPWAFRSSPPISEAAVRSSNPSHRAPGAAARSGCSRTGGRRACRRPRTTPPDGNCRSSEGDPRLRPATVHRRHALDLPAAARHGPAFHRPRCARRERRPGRSSVAPDPPAVLADVTAVAGLHMDRFPQGFLPTLGSHALQRLYRHLVESANRRSRRG